MKYLFVKFILAVLLLWTGPNTAEAFSKTDDILLKKNFYLVYLLQQTHLQLNTQPFEAVRARLEQDARHAITDCPNAACYGAALQFTDAEIASTGNELVRLSVTDPKWQTLISSLKTSHAYQPFASEADTTFIRKVWQADANGINYILRTYIEGKAPLYPKIDSISFKKEDANFRDQISKRVTKLLTTAAGNFYRLPLQLSLEALRLNGRDEAARYEPINRGMNKAPFRKVGKINWNDYQYNMILVPGLGPEQPGVALDPNGAKRCDSAAARYRAGRAPFLVVSGGHVHPNKTPYCEAVEMKKYMVRVLHIPASAVIIEPHARHTTTNLRNTNRILYGFHIPANKPVLIVTDASQNNYITGVMRERVVKELGYTPFASIKKLSATETEYMPSENSLQINSKDPLDP